MLPPIVLSFVAEMTEMVPPMYAITTVEFNIATIITPTVLNFVQQNLEVLNH